VTIAASELQESDLRNWRLLEQFRRRLAPYVERAAPGESRRKLFADDYFCLLLFGLFNPALKSMRALCHASARFEKMRQVCSRPIAPASFSEAQHTFDPETLANILRQLAREARGRAEFGDPRVREAVKSLSAVDGTVLRAVNRMAWACVGKNGSAVKLHLHFSVFDQVPEEWTITPAKVCERKTLKGKIQPGSFYVADPLYSDDYAFLGRMVRQNVDFVFRLPGNAIRTPASPLRELTPEDGAAGVVSDRLEELGTKCKFPPHRVVEIHSAGEKFVLVTNRQDLPAERQMEAMSLYFSGFVTEEELLRELNLQKS
jgi:hypothetical protein